MVYSPHGRITSDPPQNPLKSFIESQRQRFTLSVHRVEAPQGGLTGLMEAPYRLDWFRADLSYTDMGGTLHRCEFIQWQSKAHVALPTVYDLLLQLLDDLNTYMCHPTLDSYIDAGFIYRAQAEAIYRVTVERGLMVADLLGSDLQAYVNAYTEWFHNFPAAVVVGVTHG